MEIDPEESVDVTTKRVEDVEMGDTTAKNEKETKKKKEKTK
eukprot:CAMPEP_0170865340 /NCGR_PEP_ID=MMETSP0734-20130129/21203_1 /TAXON_ID=186038 /ORGANISM="Fragilariopsis kerguelensis, Strain L26-C5" /LENGTH=40 /DNA_ID= /DNA_START= /DNA_END= /DNA_ORIENTATION=